MERSMLRRSYYLCVPVRVHRRAADRAPHRGRDEPSAALSVRTLTRAVRGGVPGTGRRARAAPSGLGARRRQPHRGGRRVVVTDRLAPLRVDGRIVHQVWMPYHWGYTGLTKGNIVNDLLGVVAGTERVHPGKQGPDLRHPAWPPYRGTRPARVRRRLPPPRRDHAGNRDPAAPPCLSDGAAPVRTRIAT